jgi:hypothetical protein
VLYECDQLDTQLAKYSQNSDQTLLLKMSSGHVWPWIRYVRSRRIYPIKLPDMSNPLKNFHLNFDSWAMRHQIRWTLDIRVTLIQGISSQRDFFPNLKISLPILHELKKPRFLWNRKKSAKSKGLEPWIHSKVGGRWWGSSLHRNPRKESTKNSSNH